jgi:RNA polymerase sigma-70 factor (ECF subfamily)
LGSISVDASPAHTNVHVLKNARAAELAKPQSPAEARGAESSGASFHARFVDQFNASFPRLFRYLDRMSGESELAQDLAQEALVRLYRRGSMPDRPNAWLITVAVNLLRNARSSRRRRLRLLTHARGEAVHSDVLATPAEAVAASESRSRVRKAIDTLPERERSLLLLHAEGYRYGDIAAALQLHEASVGTLLARARKAFRAAYDQAPDAH